MINKILLFFFFFSFAFVAFSQGQSISLQPGYTNQSFYNMQNGEVLNSTNNNWDIAFHTDIYSATIRTNDGLGVELYTYPNGDTSAWNVINSSTPNILTSPMYNSDTSWNYGAFGANKSSGAMDYGWGVYNIVTHHIVGDSLFIIRTINGNWKKLWLEKKASGTYDFKYANLDGSNEFSASVPASSYQNKRFIYYSLEEDLIVDREPDLSSWDITFTKYITPVQGIPYSVTGVLSNQGIKIADAISISSPFTYTDYNAHIFSQEMNSIGYDWKTFDMSSFLYTLDNDRCFFVKDYNQNVWRVIFTQFDGSSTGNIEFNVEALTSTSASNINSSTNSIHIYPNPVRNEEVKIIYEAINLNAILKIYDVSGREVYSNVLSSNGLNTHSISPNYFEKGIYLVSLIQGNIIVNERLVIN